MFFLYDHPTGHLLAIIGEGDVRHLIGDPRDTDLENRRFPYGAAELDALAACGGDRGLVRLLREHLADGTQAAVCWGSRQDDRPLTPEEWAELQPAEPAA